MDEPGGKKENGDQAPEQVAPETPKSPPKVIVPKTPDTSQPPETPESQQPRHPYEELMDDYPLREPGEDPVWSVRIVKGWMWFLAFTTGGILLLIVLGLFYD